jgi:multiple sugar transport system permease protein
MKKIKSNSYAVFFLPAAIVSIGLIIYPLFYGFFISLFNTNLIKKWNFVGLKNYMDLIGNVTFSNSLLVNFKYIFIVVSGHLIVGTWSALLLNKDIKGRIIFRSILLLPWLIPEVVYAIIWKWIMNPQYGIVNYTLMDIGVLENPLTWFGDINIALYMVSLVSILKGYPFIMIMVLAALQSVPQEEYEAAELDGCGGIKSFFYVTVPHILPVLSVALIIDTVAWFKHFTMINIMTGGGPSERTSVLSVTIYQTAFDSFYFGSAAAMAVVVFSICYLVSLLYRKMGEYGN